MSEHQREDVADDGYIDDSLEDILATKTRGTPCKIVASREEYEACLRGPRTTASGHLGGSNAAGGDQ